jgi:hypothetical protein
MSRVHRDRIDGHVQIILGMEDHELQRSELERLTTESWYLNGLDMGRAATALTANRRAPRFYPYTKEQIPFRFDMGNEEELVQLEGFADGVEESARSNDVELYDFKFDDYNAQPLAVGKHKSSRAMLVARAFEPDEAIDGRYPIDSPTGIPVSIGRMVVFSVTDMESYIRTRTGQSPRG